VFIYGIHKAIKEPDPALKFLATFDNELTPFFTLAMSVWATLFLQFWQRQNERFAHEWNVADFARGEQVRPQW
jgi:predicted nucleic acid-binding protein